MLIRCISNAITRSKLEAMCDWHIFGLKAFLEHKNELTHDCILKISYSGGQQHVGKCKFEKVKTFNCSYNLHIS